MGCKVRGAMLHTFSCKRAHLIKLFTKGMLVGQSGAQKVVIMGDFSLILFSQFRV